MDDKNNELIINVAKLFGILTEMRKIADEETILKIIAIAQNSLSGETSLKIDNKKETIFEQKNVSSLSDDTSKIFQSELEKNSNEISLDKDKTPIKEEKPSTPLIYDPKDYSKVKEDNALNDKEEYLKTFDTKSTPSDMYYSIDNKETNDNFENVERDKGFSRTLTPPFATTSYHEDTVPYQDEMPIDNENAISAEPRNSMVDWSNASLVEPGQTFGSLR